MHLIQYSIIPVGWIRYNIIVNTCAAFMRWPMYCTCVKMIRHTLRLRLRFVTGQWPAGRTSDCSTLAPHSSVEAACYTHPTNSRHALQTQSAHAQTQPGRTPHRICCKANDTQRPCGRTTNATEQHQEQQTPNSPERIRPGNIMCACLITHPRTQQQRVVSGNTPPEHRCSALDFQQIPSRRIEVHSS